MEINFIKYSKFSFILSIILVIVSITSISIKSFNFGIDFTGGLIFDIENATNLTEIKKNYKDVIIQNYQEGVIVKISQSNIKNKDKDIEKIKTIIKNIDNNIVIKKVDFVGPQVGAMLIKKGISALLLSLVFILIYVWIRFRLEFGIGAIISLIHDIIIVLGFISLFNLDFDLTTIAAILTIIGYSINDTVVIFDRIRENLKLHYKINSIKIINVSISQTLKRTMYTSISTLLAILPLLFSNVNSLKIFSIIIFFGIIIGTYSSIFIASPILIYKKR